VTVVRGLCNASEASEIKALFSNQLDPARSNELRDRMRAEGLPI
jgi:hypothetical protein